MLIDHVAGLALALTPVVAPAASAMGVHATVPDEEGVSMIQEALPETVAVTPAKPRKLLIYTRSDYDGHDSAIAHANEAFRQMGSKTGAFEAVISNDPAVFQKESLRQFDAVFLNNTIGHTADDAQLRQNLLEFVTGGGGLMGMHGTTIAFTKSLWPAVEDWPEFGHMLGARGYAHRHGMTEEPIAIAVDDSENPLTQAFAGQGFAWTDEIFRFTEPYSRQRVRVLLSVDVPGTDLSHYAPGDECLREDGDYALAWIKRYGQGRVFYSALAHGPKAFTDPRMLRFYLDATQFVLGDLDVPTTPSGRLSPAVRAQEKLGWRLGIEAYTFHKFTFFEAIDKTAALGLAYMGGLSGMHHVSDGIPKHFNQHLTDDELRQIRIKLDTAGVRLLTYYSQDVPRDEAECRKLFEFARKMGIETIMCEPPLEVMEMLDRLANEHGINVAIHNHDEGISPHYWRPEGVLKACEGRSERIGACPDLGYWIRAGIDPLEGLRLLKDRVLVLHMHDLHEFSSSGHDVAWGQGAGRSEEFLRQTHAMGIEPTMIGIEYAHDFNNNAAKVGECVEFFNATTLKLAAETADRPTTHHKGRGVRVRPVRDEGNKGVTR